MKKSLKRPMKPKLNREMLSILDAGACREPESL
jgi:hypothetical protein